MAESDVELALASGVGEQHAISFVGDGVWAGAKPAGWCLAVCEEFEACSVVVDAERELAYLLGYGDGKDSERAGCTRPGLPEGTGLKGWSCGLMPNTVGSIGHFGHRARELLLNQNAGATRLHNCLQLIAYR